MQDNDMKRKKTHKLSRYFAVAFLIVLTVIWHSGCGNKADGQGDGLEQMSVSDISRNDAPEENSGSVREDAQNVDTLSDDDRETVFVYVCGAVHSPGVYEMEKDARVFEAVRMAGGVTDEAAEESVNQARTVADGEQIYVPTREEAERLGTGVVGEIVTGETDGKVNINTAGKEELMMLTGIGEAKAQSILDYRQEHGRFSDIEELMQIEGIKEGVFNKIKDDIMI